MVTVTRADFTLELLNKGSICRNCDKPIPPGRYYYCCDECRNEIYGKYIWEKVRHAVFKRDNYKCRRCGKLLQYKDPEHPKYYKTEAYDIHHVRTFLQLMRDVGTGFRGSHLDYKRALMDAFFDKTNLITVCLKCHGKEDHPRFVKWTDRLEDRLNWILYPKAYDSQFDGQVFNLFGCFWKHGATQTGLNQFF